MSSARFQVRFTKTGLLRWTSHRDLARLWERMVRRCSLRLAMSEGFSPKPKISFPSALALGLESEDEVVELTLVETISADELLGRLRADATPGLEIVSVLQIAAGEGKAQFEAASYALEFPADMNIDEAELQQRIRELLERESITFQRKGASVEAILAEQLKELSLSDGKLQMTIKGSRTASLRPTDVLAALGLEQLLQEGGRLLRTQTILDRQYASS